MHYNTHCNTNAYTYIGPSYYATGRTSLKTGMS